MGRKKRRVPSNDTSKAVPPTEAQTPAVDNNGDIVEAQATA
eukprot:CAMPEP_0197823486 /NCGR_PEP_ID=MMETSP1437-20131217/844_1 /TAXON_ID=49252 ORGANISM="Eucampia antarctica, Strain CCMP1452" /NCGR_SAMPLE_ID=MMETSP1437 /ASSEMBLY_ACC=CAM_ASM_001096 /LENGTH=40 /DNA_ID= /DNA_START= /DNA_END= /DNA_ORIENTATION=